MEEKVNMNDKEDKVSRFDPTIPGLTPIIEISPYSLSSRGNVSVPDWQNGISRFHGTDNWVLLPRATAGLKMLKEIIGIERITILTTFNTHYLSGCILRAFQGSQVLRELCEPVDAVMVVHEWGIPFPEIGKVISWTRDNDVPLIEDCALTMRSDLGRSGDFVLYSFPKLLPMNHGGLLIGMGVDTIYGSNRVQTLEDEDAKSIGSQYLRHTQDLNENFIIRRRNWKYLNNKFISAGFRPYFNIGESDVPYIYMLHTDRSEELSVKMKEHGIEAGVYWKNNGLFLPCHQALTPEHLDHIVEAVIQNINRCERNKQ
ncbi:MAG: hypothetical protein JXA22_07815 [Candidatus Thermoplasmatota archaeon]|nr:hypothetical protein [Candidatus Thermoplasmatota archaeon]